MIDERGKIKVVSFIINKGLDDIDWTKLSGWRNSSDRLDNNCVRWVLTDECKQYVERMKRLKSFL